MPDQQLRDIVLPGLHAQPGMRYAYAGRAGAGDLGPRLVASIWEFEGGGGQPPAQLAGLLPFEGVAGLSEVTLELVPLVVNLPFESAEEPRILRVFRGQTGRGGVEHYIRAARDGTYEDVLAQHGPAAIFLGVQQPDRFLSVSVWTAWDNIEAATGGNLREPIGTRDLQHLVAGKVEHYEIVPGSLLGPPHGNLGG